MARSINDGTSTQQTNMPKERHTGGKSRQDITETTRGFLLCVACDDEPPLDDLWKAPCQHAYCTECIEQLFRLSMDDETLYPPKCCQQIIPWSDVEAFVSQELATAFKGKRDELVTQDKTYCSDPTCSTFIGSSHIAADTSTATCPTCKKLTCAMCKAASHAKECQADPSLQATLEVAKGNGWQRCQECGRVIDRTGGCNHISCPCGYQFCYTCASRWYSCNCEEHPFLDADEIVQDMILLGLPIHVIIERMHDLGLAGEIAAVVRPPPAPQNAGRDAVARAAPVAVAEPQIDHRDRNHEGWRFVHGAGVCAHCGEDMPVFLMQCETCHMRACRRCTLNRL